MKSVCLENKWRKYFAPFLLMVFCFIAAFSVQAQMKEATTKELKELIQQNIAVVDVRTPGEWRRTGVIPQSHLLTFFDQRGNYDLDQWLSKFDDLAQPSDPVVILCDVGNRSKLIAQFLHSKLKYHNVYNATFGIRDWIRKGGETVRWP